MAQSNIVEWANDMINREIIEVYENISQEHFFEHTDSTNAAMHAENIEELNSYLTFLNIMRDEIANYEM